MGSSLASIPSLIVILLVPKFSLIAFGLAIAAESRRSTASVVPTSDMNYSYCVYDSDKSTGFGAGAFLLLLTSQVMLMASTKCFCCGTAMRRPSGCRSCALLFFFLSWITFLIAEACLLAGAVRNAYHTRYCTLFFADPPTCETVRKGVFAIGALSVFFTTVFGILYYITFSMSMAQNTGTSSYGYGKDSIGMSTY